MRTTNVNPTTTLIERKRANLQRRLLDVRRRHDLPALTRVETHDTLDALLRVKGDGLTDMDLRTIHKLASRGMFTR